ncbi:hypothetical protein KFK09_003084 [Dendrobium nobile]|uniref:Uncharacterized protein n=1 Tax=Dendrobium nobile TaxID=94219 RepID=A0A8T3C945_DENNO|nr:hypothetical protein KFK09_003084 [Dendrobium nobile]
MLHQKLDNKTTEFLKITSSFLVLNFLVSRLLFQSSKPASAIQRSSLFQSFILYSHHIAYLFDKETATAFVQRHPIKITFRLCLGRLSYCFLKQLSSIKINILHLKAALSSKKAVPNII